MHSVTLSVNDREDEGRRSMLARCGPGSIDRSFGRAGIDVCRHLASKSTPVRGAVPSKSGRQSTINFEDLPLRAYDINGKPATPLPDFTTYSRTGPKLIVNSKGKEKEKTIVSSPADASEVSVTLPRSSELGPEGQEWPPLAKDVLTNLARFPSCILLTRVGGFYESYFEQAPLLANLLGIKLANRSWGGRNVAMAGFPIVQLDKYLKILVMDHRRLVAICDEFKEIEQAPMSLKRASTSKATLNEIVQIKRRVTRVVSPGTLIDEQFLDPFSSNWVLSISRIGNQYGLAWLDISTADFYTTSCDDEQSLRDEVARIGPTEVVLEERAFDIGLSILEKGETLIKPDGNALWEVLDPDKTHITLCQRKEVSGTTKEHEEDANDVEDIAVANLTAHIRTRLLDQDLNSVEDITGELEGPLRRRREQVMLIDANTLIALEINASLRRPEAAYNTNSVNPSVRGSLLSNIRRTVTKGGARLLAQWLSAPSTSLTVIHRRQSLVALFLQQQYFLEDVRIMLRKGAGDVSRALQRIITGRNDVQDLLEVRDFTSLCDELVKMLSKEMDIARDTEALTEHLDGWVALKSLIEGINPLMHLGQRLGEAIDESVIEKRTQEQEVSERELEMQVFKEGAIHASGARPRKQNEWRRLSEPSDDESLWGAPFEHLIRPNASYQLETLTKEHRLLRRRARLLELELREKYGERITFKHLLGQGFVVHLSDYRETSKGAATIDKEMNLAYKSKTTRTYYHEGFTKIGSRLLRVERELNDKEAVELQRLRLDVLVELGKLRKNSSVINELDCLLGFAKLAQVLNFCRPIVNDGDEIDIKAGRHLSVEMALLHREVCDSTITMPARSFTPNDLHLDSNSRLHLITGPNMGGKSTLLRMISIITILAQIGSFVPATSCTIGIVDQIFSRIGAHDSINTEKSTFMVEMLEVSEFLKRSTRRSLIICDEIGRGTDHKTGIAIAFATAQHLLDKIQCKCLFATHLYKVGDLLQNRSGISFYCTDLQENESGDIVFSHKLRPGLNRNSHGLSIARLAGIPDDVLQVARDTLDGLREDAD